MTESAGGEPGVSATASARPLSRNRFYQAMFWSQTCTDFAEQLVLVSITWAALHAFGGGTLGLVLAVWAVPRGLLLLFGGVLVDRSDRRFLAIAVGFLLALLNLAGAFITGHQELGLWLGLAAALGILDAVRLPMGAAMLPLLVDQDRLVQANRWVSLREWAAMTSGPALGGVLVAALGSPGTLYAGAALYGASSLLMLLLPRLSRPAGEERQAILKELRGGLSFVLNHPRLRVLLPVFAVANLFILGLIGVAIPLMAKNILKAGPQGLGFLSAAFGAGLVLGTLLCNRLPKSWQSSQKVIFSLFMLSDALLATVGLARDLPLAVLAYCGSGLAAGPAATYYRTLLQTLPPEQYLGRVNSIARATSFGLEPVSVAGVGSLSARMSAATLLLVGGCAAVVADLTGFGLSRRKPAAARQEPVPDAESVRAG
ncbi:MFS transporter [Streptomyces sp. NRRL F-5126]|uniref:MFS transporter n=1 Tax=Streptomyces sp. NRRL F-5126 TaxID=1463857 RepID=UPI0004C803FC|nr:MFS transporter [Streptomyces sp. NRRL F-5126]